MVLADGTGVFLGENPIIARGEYIEKNPEIVQIYMDTYKKAAELLAADTEKYAEQYSDYFGLDTSIIRSALANAKQPIAITDADVTDLQKTADFLKNENLVTKEIKVEDYVDFTFSEGLK